MQNNNFVQSFEKVFHKSYIYGRTTKTFKTLLSVYNREPLHHKKTKGQLKAESSVGKPCSKFIFRQSTTLL